MYWYSVGWRNCGLPQEWVNSVPWAVSSPAASATAPSHVQLHSEELHPQSCYVGSSSTQKHSHHKSLVPVTLSQWDVICNWAVDNNMPTLPANYIPTDTQYLDLNLYSGSSHVSPEHQIHSLDGVTCDGMGRSCEKKILIGWRNVRNMRWRAPDQEVDQRGHAQRLCKKIARHVISTRRMLSIAVEADKDWTMIRMVSGWMFFLVLAHPDSLGQWAVKQLLLF